jgi:hypothetical protein
MTYLGTTIIINNNGVMLFFSLLLLTIIKFINCELRAKFYKSGLGWMVAVEEPPPPPPSSSARTIFPGEERGGPGASPATALSMILLVSS